MCMCVLGVEGELTYMKNILLFKNKVSLERIWGFPSGSVGKNPPANA